jgi:hypothetical protein
MAVRELFSTISGVAGSAVDGPVRAIVEAVLEERGFIDQAAFAAARTRLEGVEAKLAGIGPRVEAAEQRANHLAEEVRRLQAANDDFQRDLSDAREQTIQAVARADAAEQRLAAQEEALAQLRAQLEAAAKAGTKAAAPADDRPVVGPGGEVKVRGEDFFVDAAHAGESYTVAHNGAVRVGRRLVKKSTEPVG